MTERIILCAEPLNCFSLFRCFISSCNANETEKARARERASEEIESQTAYDAIDPDDIVS